MSRPSPRAIKEAMLHAGDLQSESQHSVLRRRLMQYVQCGACPKPLQLSVAVRVLEPHGFTAAIRVVDAALDRFCQCKTVKPDQVEPVIGQNPVVVVRIDKRQCKHALLLQVRLMNASEAAGNHRRTTQKPRRQRRMLAAAAFSVIRIADDHPSLPRRTVLTGRLRRREAALACQYI